jgi:hypothetical protein
MRTLTTLLIIGCTLAIWTPNATAQKVVFYDDFESGTLDNWTPTYGTPFTIANVNADPPGGIYSAHATSEASRMHHNLIADNGGLEVSGASSFTAYIYDGTMTRWHVQALGYSGTGLPNGGATPDGALSQLLAIGQYGAVTLPGEVYDGTKYQGRVVYGSSAGWFNLNAPGAPSRSPGWHKFTIERLADETTINFYVDDILSRTITGATPQSWDTVTMGYGAGSLPGDAWFDGISVTVVPEPSLLGMWVLGGWALARSLTNRRRKE